MIKMKMINEIQNKFNFNALDLLKTDGKCRILKEIAINPSIFKHIKFTKQQYNSIDTYGINIKQYISILAE